MSQPTLSRHYKAGKGTPRRIDENILDALSAVFKDIPRGLWRGEPLDKQMERTLAEASIDDLILAKRISKLQTADRRLILEQIENFLERDERLKKALTQSNVTSIDRARTPPQE